MAELPCLVDPEVLCGETHCTIGTWRERTMHTWQGQQQSETLIVTRKTRLDFGTFFALTI